MESGSSILFIESTSGSKEYFAVFEATDGSEEGTPAGGYLYIYDSTKKNILKHLEVYSNPVHEIREHDIRILWSIDGTKCGVIIWGKMRGVIDITGNQQFGTPMDNPAGSAISDLALLEDFIEYMDQDQFIRARQRFWKQRAKEYEPNVQLRHESETAIETNFLIFKRGTGTLFAVFEDDGDTGYLYIFDSSKEIVTKYLQIYDNAEKLNIVPDDVQVIWSENYHKCGVLIWGVMRGIVDLIRNQEGRVKMEKAETPGISDVEWLNGFKL